jgi:hypothetical protein
MCGGSYRSLYPVAVICEGSAGFLNKIMQYKIILFSLALFAAIIAISAAYQWIAQISYDKPRKSPITKQHKQLFKPLL